MHITHHQNSSSSHNSNNFNSSRLRYPLTIIIIILIILHKIKYQMNNLKTLIFSIIIINFLNLRLLTIIFFLIRLMNPTKISAIILITLLSVVRFNHNLHPHKKIYWTMMMIMIKNQAISLLIIILMLQLHIILTAPNRNNNLKFLFHLQGIIFKIII